MMKTQRLLIMMCSVWLLGTLGAQAASVGTSGGLLLVTANTARNTALGGAGSTLTDDPGVVYYNPAGLYSIKRIKGLFTHQGGLGQDYTENLNIAFPWTDLGVFGATLVYHGMPTLNDAGNDAPSVEANDKLFMASWARSGREWLSGLSYGVSLKFMNSVLGSYSANAVALDAGALWEAMPDVVVGLAVRNAGTPMKFDTEADPLPLRVALSGKYYLLSGTLENFFVVGEVEETTEAVTGVHLGAEFTYAETFSGRIGYTSAAGSNEGVALGVGLQTAVAAYNIRVDYAYKIITWSDTSYEGLQLFTLGLIY